MLQIIEFSPPEFDQSHAKKNFAFSPAPFYIRKGGAGLNIFFFLPRFFFFGRSRLEGVSGYGVCVCA